MLDKLFKKKKTVDRLTREYFEERLRIISVSLTGLLCTMIEKETKNRIDETVFNSKILTTELANKKDYHVSKQIEGFRLQHKSIDAILNDKEVGKIFCLKVEEMAQKILKCREDVPDSKVLFYKPFESYPYTSASAHDEYTGIHLKATWGYQFGLNVPVLAMEVCFKLVKPIN